MLGAFQAESKAWMVERVPENFSFQLLEPDWERYAEPLKHGKWRIPALTTCAFAKFVNGPESFTPDNNFIMGETPELKNLFVAAGFNSVGIASAGGAGNCRANPASDRLDRRAQVCFADCAAITGQPGRRDARRPFG